MGATRRTSISPKWPKPSAEIPSSAKNKRMVEVAVWDFKGEEGKSLGDGNQMFGRRSIRSVSPALAGGIFTTEPPRKAWLKEQN